MSDYDLSDLDLEIIEDSPSQEGEFERMERIYQRSAEIVKKAMENVIQEILITLEDGSNHVVYVTSLTAIEGGGVSLEFSTLSEDRKAELTPHVEKCIKMQIEHSLKEKKKNRFKLF